MCSQPGMEHQVWGGPLPEGLDCSTASLLSLSSRLMGLVPKSPFSSDVRYLGSSAREARATERKTEKM